MITQRQNGSLFTDIKNNIAYLEFGHPASNSFPSELLSRLTNELNALAKNDDVSVIVLKSEGERAFCAGASFDELVSILPDGIYLTRIKRVGNKVSIYGRAEYNSQISALMRNVEASSWLAHPALEEIKNPNRKNTTLTKTKKKDTLNNFKLTMEQVDQVHGS